MRPKEAMHIRDVLEKEGRKVFTMESDKSLEEAIDLMVEKETNGIIIREGDHPVGILTERDVLRNYIKYRRRPFREISLDEAMTNKVIVATPEDDIASTISMMVRSDIRHLPVVMEGKLVAMLLICDLIEHQVGALTAELHYLEDYVADLQEAGID